MRALLLAGVATVSLAGCADLKLGGVEVTQAQQVQITAETIDLIKHTTGFDKMSAKDKAAFILAHGQQIAADAGVDLTAAQPYINLAVLAAS